MVQENEDIVQVGLTRKLARNSEIDFDKLRLESQKHTVSKSYKYDKC